MKNKPVEAKDYTTGRAAHELRVSPNHVRALCQSGLIAARATRGGHWRIPKDEIKRLRREGVPDPPPATPTEDQTPLADSPVNSSRHQHPALLAEPSQEAIASADEVVRLENEVKSIGLKRAMEEHLDWFRDRERNRTEEKAERDRQNLERKAARLHRDWENSCLEYAFECIPEDAPESARLEVSNSVREALADLDPSDPEEVTGQIIGAAVDKALLPWRRGKEIEHAAQESKNQLPFWARSYSFNPPSEWETRAVNAARETIQQLPNNASFEEMRSVSTRVGKEVAQEYANSEARKQEAETRKSIVESVFLSNSSEQAKARQDVKEALETLPFGTGRPEMVRACDEVMQPFRAAAEAARAKASAASLAEMYMHRVDSYLEKLAAAPHCKWDLGSYFDRQRLANEIKQNIRPILTEAIIEEHLSAEDARTFIESLVSSELGQ